MTDRTVLNDIGYKGLYEGVKPSVVTSQHSIDDFFRAFREGKSVKVSGFGAAHIQIDRLSGGNYNEVSFEELPATTIYPAKIAVPFQDYIFKIKSIEIVYNYGKNEPSFIIYGYADQSEEGNYYGTHRWTEYFKLDYYGLDKTFTFDWKYKGGKD